MIRLVGTPTGEEHVGLPSSVSPAGPDRKSTQVTAPGGGFRWVTPTVFTVVNVLPGGRARACGVAEMAPK
jgi:hypothetical protein